jgi:DNA-binding response OmpR family regulator
MAVILIVDDEADIVELLGEFLTGEGYQVNAAFSYGEALAKIETHRPDIVLLDVMLEKGSGIELLRKIREEDKNLKVIMCSGCDEEDYWPEAEKLGAAGRINKPFDLAALDDLLKKTLE